MNTDFPDHHQVELVAAALCDLDFFPDAWELTEERQRQVYRCEAMDLLVTGDPWAALQVLDLGGVLETEAQRSVCRCRSVVSSRRLIKRGARDRRAR